MDNKINEKSKEKTINSVQNSENETVNQRFKDFSDIYNEIIEKVIKSFLESLEPEYVKAVDFRVADLKKHFQKCNSYFYYKRDVLKDLYYGKRFADNKNQNQSTDYISDDYQFDFHKITSIVTCTLIRHKPFIFDVEKAKKYKERLFPTNTSSKKSTKEINPEEKKWTIDHLLINYSFAFKASMIIMWEMIFFPFDNEDEKIQEAKAIMLSNRDLCLYPPSQNQESFENSLILDFAKRDLDNRSFDYFMYSVVLYQLEKYYIKELNLEEYFKQD